MRSTVKLVISVLSVLHGINVIHANFWSRYIDVNAAQVTSVTTNFMDTCSNRQAPGFVCMDCTVLARCIRSPNGWETIPLEACDAGQNLYCHASEQRCSPNPGPCNPGVGIGGGSFACTSVGVFPDPFNCQMYHMCFSSAMTIVSVNVVCGGNSAFNSVTNDCSSSLTHPNCQGSQFTCNNVGDMGPWAGNPNIYYICMASTGATRVLFPSLFRCPVGEIFQNGQCANGNGGGIDGGVFNCQRSGLFPDPYDCRAYFHCNGVLQSQRIICPTGTYFNRITLGCIRGTC